VSTPIRITGLTATEDPALTAGGWTRRTVTTVERAEEMSQLYSEIGFEVMVRRLDESNYAEECTGCASGPSPVVVYTRRPAQA